MVEVLTDMLDANIDFKMIFIGIAIYLALIWTVFSFWVLVDAQKRYRKIYLSLLFFIFVLIFNFPALIFYLVVRPDQEYDDYFDYLGLGSGGGVNVPIVNFVGEKGVEMSLELKINRNSPLPSKDMVVNVDWTSSKDSYIKSEKKDEEVVEGVEGGRRLRFPRVDLKPALSRISHTVKAPFTKIKSISLKKPESTQPKVTTETKQETSDTKSAMAKNEAGSIKDKEEPSGKSAKETKDEKSESQKKAETATTKSEQKDKRKEQ